MYLEVYVDVLFLILWIPEVLSLRCLAAYLHIVVRWQKILFVSLWTAGLSVAAMLVLRTYGWFSWFAADVAIQLLGFRSVFGKKSLRQSLVLWLYQKILYVCLGGMLSVGWKTTSFTVPSLLTGMLLVGVLAARAIHLLRKRRRKLSMFYSVELVWHGKSCRVMAFLDTGNQLHYGRDIPVVLVSPEVAKQIGFKPLEPDETYRAVPYASIGCPTGLLHGFLCDKLQIGDNCYTTVVAGVTKHPLSKNGDYQMLLHPSLVLEVPEQEHDSQSSRMIG